MGSESDLAAHLQKWAVEEMHFYSQGATVHKLPTAEDFKELCRGRNAAIWKWVLTHIHSKETVKTVKGNLSIKNKTGSQSYKVRYGEQQDTFDEDRCNLLNRRAQLSGQITTALRDISHLNTDLERIQTDIGEKEHAYRKQTGEIDNTRRKTALLTAYSMKCTDTRTQYEEYTRCIDTRVEQIKQKASRGLQAEEYYSKGAPTDGSADTAALETACGKHVRECCESIGDFLQETLKGTFGGDKAEFARQKEPLWQKVEQVTGSYAADQILTGLLTNTRDTCNTLKDMTDGVDIRRDAQNLRFKYEPSGQVHDLSTPPSLLRSVRELLQDRATEHLRRFIESQKCSNLTRTLEQSLVTVKSQVDKRLQKLLSQKAKDLQIARTLELSLVTVKSQVDKRLQKLLSQKTKDLQIARSLFEVDMELAGIKAELLCLTGEGDQLREVVQQSYREKQELVTKYHRIQEFQQITDRKQNLIQVLVKQNMNSQSRLDSQIAEIEQYVQRSLKTHESQIETVSDKLTHCINTEIHQFANLSLPYLMFSQIDNALKTAVLDLSVNQMSPMYIQPALQTVLQCLGFPSFQAPEMVLKHCLTLKAEIEDISHKLERQSWANQWRKKKDGEKDVAVVIADLCEAMREEDKLQLQKMLPLLEDRVSRTDIALNTCQHSRNKLKAWWEQPGQMCVPWITVDGHNLQHYMEKWTLLATGLRQALVK